MAETRDQKIARLKGDLVRSDGRIERVCEHGCGHPVGSVGPWQDWMGTHGCCGCCRDYEVDFLPFVVNV